MKRFVSVWLPHFAIERMERAQPGVIPRDVPCALIETTPQGLRITAVNRPAARDGVRPGLRLVDTRAAIPGLQAVPAEPDRDHRALTALAMAAGRYGPARNTDGADRLWIDITGVAHLFGGEDSLANDLIWRLETAGYTARVGIADTAAAAIVLARHAMSTARSPLRKAIAIAPPGETREALAQAPIEGLRLADSALSLLKRLGLRRIGQLYGLPRIALARRFRDVKPRGKATGGSYARTREDLAQAVIMRLDQALGLVSDPRISLVEPPARFASQNHPEGLISHDGLISAVRDLTTALCADLGHRHEGAQRLCLTLYRVDGHMTDITIGTSHPTRDQAHILRLIEEKLANVDLGFGIDMMTLAAREIDRLSDMQTTLDARAIEHRTRETARLLDRLQNRLGREHIIRLSLSESHIPERAQQRTTIGTLPPPLARPYRPLPRTSQPPRPPFLLERPEPIDVIAELPDGPPARFRWRRISRRVLKANGPERIAPEWWRHIGAASSALAISGRAPTAHRTRDYYEIEDDRGGRYWVYRAGLYRNEAEDQDDAQPTWFLHGLFG